MRYGKSEVKFERRLIDGRIGGSIKEFRACSGCFRLMWFSLEQARFDELVIMASPTKGILLALVLGDAMGRLPWQIIV
jgi:hypothetical protein